MTRREFERRYQHLDALSIGRLWRLFLVLKFSPHEWADRQALLDVLDRLQGDAALRAWDARRVLPPQPAARPADLRPVS
jgi:hypothetical protein